MSHRTFQIDANPSKDHKGVYHQASVLNKGVSKKLMDFVSQQYGWGRPN